MINFDKKKQELIQEIRRSGFKNSKGESIISFYELAFNLNNYWKARYFLDKKKVKDYINSEYHRRWAIKSWHLHEFRAPINRLVGKMKEIKRVEQGMYNTFYILKEKEQ